MTSPRSPSNAHSLILGFCLLCWAALAQAAGTVTHLSGMLTAIGPDGVARFLSQNSQVIPGDMLITQQGTYARIKFTDGGEITLRPNSQVRLDKYVFDQARASEDNAVMSLIKGGFRAVTGLIGKRSRDNYKVNAQTATIGIRGTTFAALTCQGDCANIKLPDGTPLPDGLHVNVIDGVIHVTSSAGTQIFKAGENGYVADPKSLPIIVPPGKSIDVQPKDPPDKQNGLGKGNSDQCGIK